MVQCCRSKVGRGQEGVQKAVSIGADAHTPSRGWCEYPLNGARSAAGSQDRLGASVFFRVRAVFKETAREFIDERFRRLGAPVLVQTQQFLCGFSLESHSVHFLRPHLIGSRFL